MTDTGILRAETLVGRSVQPANQRPSRVLTVVAGLLLVGGLISASFSAFWLIQAQEARKQLATLQLQAQQSGNQAASAPRLPFGDAFLVSKTEGAELLAVVALLGTERIAYQCLSLTLLLWLVGLLFLRYARPEERQRLMERLKPMMRWPSQASQPLGTRSSSPLEVAQLPKYPGT